MPSRFRFMVKEYSDILLYLLTSKYCFESDFTHFTGSFLSVVQVVDRFCLLDNIAAFVSFLLLFIAA